MSTKSIVLSFIGFIVFSIFVIGGGCWLHYSKNPETPAGYVGYLTQGSWFGEASFIGTQKGPTSPGRYWLANVVNVSITPYTFTEPFAAENAVLSLDQLSIQFQVHITWKVNESKVKDFIEKYAYGDSTNPDKLIEVAYVSFIKEPLRSYAREEVAKTHSTQINANITKIGDRIFTRICERAKGTPFDIISVVVGNIQFPKAVADAVSNKIAAQQRLEQKETEIEIATKDAEIRVAQANGIAESMRIINNQLASAYLQHEAIETQKAMAGSPNHSAIYIPVGPMCIPLVATGE